MSAVLSPNPLTWHQRKAGACSRRPLWSPASPSPVPHSSANCISSQGCGPRQATVQLDVTATRASGDDEARPRALTSTYMPGPPVGCRRTWPDFCLSLWEAQMALRGPRGAVEGFLWNQASFGRLGGAQLWLRLAGTWRHPAWSPHPSSRGTT